MTKEDIPPSRAAALAATMDFSESAMRRREFPALDGGFWLLLFVDGIALGALVGFVESVAPVE